MSEEIKTVELIFGERVRNLRKIIKISQDELAYRSGLHRNYISDVERGTRNISLKAIYKIARGLNVSVEALFIK
jgi:transcriptional regulator with XRE-family HTH domain